LLDTFRDVSTHDDYPLTVVEYGLYAIMLIGYLAVRRRRPDRNLDFLVLASGILFFLVGVLRYLAPSLWLAVPMHFHRVKVYALVVLVPLLVWLLPKRGGDRTTAVTRVVGLPVLSALAVAILVVGAFIKPHVFRPSWRPPELTIEGVRVLTVERIPEVPYWHNFRHHLADEGHLVSKGLFIEASPDAPFLLSLEQILDRDHQLPLRWGIDWSPQVMAAPDVIDRIPFLLDVFGIQAVATDRPLATDRVGTPGSAAGEYRVFERPSQSLVDVPAWPIKFSGRRSTDREWQALTRQWFLAGDELLVIDGVPRALARSGRARLAGEQRHFNVLDIDVEASEPVPVSIRMGYSDKWRAYAASGELPVYRVTPNNMLVVAAEDFELRYEPLNGFNYLGLLIAVLSLIGWFRLRAPDASPRGR
jgi:hypothetical protein